VSDVWGLGVYGERYFPTESQVLPFAGLSASFLDSENTDPVLVGGVTGGGRYCLGNTVALTAHVTANWASENIYDASRTDGVAGTTKAEDGTNFDFFFGFGVRFLFY
jgi:hypothetical protein